MQVDSLSEINEALRAEYSLRRRMLIERAKVTLQVSCQGGLLQEVQSAVQY